MSTTFYQSLGKTESWPNLSQVHPASLTYDDVLLVPQAMTAIGSRKETDISVKFGPFTLQKPIVTAPMDTVSGEEMAHLMQRMGGLAFMPRVFINEALAACERLQKDKVDAVYSIGLKDALKNAEAFKKLGAKALLLDVAHGGMQNIVETAEEIKNKLKIAVIAGNIVSYDQAMTYKKAGLSIAKAIAAGARVIMVGSMLTGTEEAPGEVVAGVKKARGQASEDYMKDNGSKLGEFRSAEGIMAMVPYKGSAEYIINDLVGGLRSAMSYVGAKNIEEFQTKAQFVIASHAAQGEGVAHINRG